MAYHPRGVSVTEFRSVETILGRIGDKWAILAVCSLAEGPLRFNDLQRLIPTLSGKMLITTLRRLMADGYVDQAPARTGASKVYLLTPAGFDLLQPAQALADWAVRAGGARAPLAEAAE